MLLWGALLVGVVGWPPPAGEGPLWSSPFLKLLGGVALGVGYRSFWWAWGLPVDGSPWPVARRGVPAAWLMAALPVLVVLFAGTETGWQSWAMPIFWAVVYGSLVAGSVLGFVTRAGGRGDVDAAGRHAGPAA